MNHKGDTDWNINSVANDGMDGKVCHLPRGRFLGGSSGCNGTICVRGVKQDYDDWGAKEWSGDEMFRAMRKVCIPASTVTNCAADISNLPGGELPSTELVHT